MAQNFIRDISASQGELDLKCSMTQNCKNMIHRFQRVRRICGLSQNSPSTVTNLPECHNSGGPARRDVPRAGFDGRKEAGNAEFSRRWGRQRLQAVPRKWVGLCRLADVMLPPVDLCR